MRSQRKLRINFDERYLTKKIDSDRMIFVVKIQKKMFPAKG